MMFRIDDIGSSTKHFNQYGRKLFRLRGIPYFYFPLSNFLFLKRIKPFKMWGPYDELEVSEWRKVLDFFQERSIKPIVSITATWVGKDNSLTPFPEKFPDEASFLKEAADNGKIIIANHGLSHCVIGEHLPRLFSSNRQYHREFWPYLNQSIHDEHIFRSQEILENYFNRKIEIFVPPGNVWSVKTYNSLKKTNIKKVLSLRYMMDSKEKMDGIEFVPDSESNTVNLHDKELKLFGVQWLKKICDE